MISLSPSCRETHAQCVDRKKEGNKKIIKLLYQAEFPVYLYIVAVRHKLSSIMQAYANCLGWRGSIGDKKINIALKSTGNLS